MLLLKRRPLPCTTNKTNHLQRQITRVQARFDRWIQRFVQPADRVCSVDCRLKAPRKSKVKSPDKASRNPPINLEEIDRNRRLLYPIRREKRRFIRVLFLYSTKTDMRKVHFTICIKEKELSPRACLQTIKNPLNLVNFSYEKTIRTTR